MSEIEEAIEILNWTQRASEMRMVKLSYVSKPGSQQYAKPISKTVFRDIKTHPRDLTIQLSNRQRARMRAEVVLPTPRLPENTKACGTRP